jgi:hypothetical protein
MANRLICFILSAFTIQSPVALATTADGGACDRAVKKATEKCPERVAALPTGEGVGGMNGGAVQLEDKSKQTAAYGTWVKGNCEQAAEDCKKGCTKADETKRCEPFTTRAAMAGQEATQAAQAGELASQTGEASGAREDASGRQHASDSGGGMNPGMAAGLLGLAGGMMAALMAKKNDQNQQPQIPPLPTGALQANLTVDCSKTDAGNYTECNGQLSQTCMTSLSTPICQTFASRYCGPATGASAASAAAAPAAPALTIPNSGVVAATGQATLFRGVMGASGEGLGTPFCKMVIATNYCSQSGRDRCPSCVQLAINRSPVCASDPALCLAQNSAAQIDQARQTCPTDPAFSDPAYAAGGGAQLPAQLQGGAPAVLPQQDGLNQTIIGSAGSASSTITAGSGGGISTASIRSIRSSSAGQSAGGKGGDGIAEGNGRGGGGWDRVDAGSSSSGGGSLRATASFGKFRPSSAAQSGPASDVEDQYGLSVFALGSQTIRNRCAAGKLLNCP